MIYLIAVIVALLGFVYFEYSKRKSAEALNTNLETKEKVDNIQKGVDVDDAKIEAEKQKQADIQKAADEEKAKDVTQKDVTDFFNNRK